MGWRACPRADAGVSAGGGPGPSVFTPSYEAVRTRAGTVEKREPLTTSRENTMSEPVSAIDTALFDVSTAAPDDFYRHVNGGWLDANPVPPEYGVWDEARILHARNQDVLHQFSRTLHPGTDPARVRRQDGGRLLRGGDGRGVDRRRRRERRSARTSRASTPPRPSPTSATSCATFSAAVLRRSTRSASHRTSMTRAPTSSTSARAGWGSPSAGTTRVTTSSRSRCARST